MIGTKLDTLMGGVDEAREMPGCPEVLISAAAGLGIRELLIELAPLVAQARAAQPAADTFVLHRPEEEGVRVERNDDASWTVVGRNAERAVAVSDITDGLALQHVHNQLKRIGVDKALQRAGARTGELVHVGTFTFTMD